MHTSRGSFVSLKRLFSLLSPLPRHMHNLEKLSLTVSSCFISLPCPVSYTRTYLLMTAAVFYFLSVSLDTWEMVSLLLSMPSSLVACTRCQHVAPSHSICTADLDECALGLHNCSGGCTNTRGGHRCTCPDGYRVQPFVNSCEGKHGRLLIEFIVEFVA